ncbi:MAG: flagellar assembly protein FliW [Syntrophomonadaceae bacterium]|nr:flagellar assembly protein FliW [Syntrophomonadaceae bacterium]
MKIESKILGEIEFEKAAIINLPEGIPAFEQEKQFIIIPLDKSAPFFYLQSVNTPDLCLLIADPFTFFPGYEIELTDEELERLEAGTEEKNIAVYTILNVPGDFKKTTANLMAPLIINAKNKKGLQFIPVNSDYTTKHYIFPQEDPNTAQPAAQEGR